MKQERRKILEMLAEGCISSEEAHLLLDTLNELQANAQAKKPETMFDFLLDLGNLKTMVEEYGRISPPSSPQTPPIPYFNWQPV